LRAEAHGDDPAYKGVEKGHFENLDDEVD